MDITLKNDNVLNDYYNKINELIIKAKQNVRKNINYEIIKTFSNKLTHEFRRGYSIPSLKKMKKFYLTYKSGYTLCNQLSWSHNNL